MPTFAYVRRIAWAGYAAAILAAGLVTVLIGALQGYLQASDLSVLYLLAVLAVAIAFGRGPAIILSVAAFLTFNWFFVEPLHSFTVARPEEWVALIVFLIVAIITGQLAASQRLRAQEAEQREREAEVLYDVARLMGEADLEAALRAVAERLQQAMRLAAVAIELPGSGKVSVGEPEGVRLLESAPLPPAEVLGSGQAAIEGRKGSTGRWVRIVPPFAPGPQNQALRGRLHVVPVKAGEGRQGVLLLLSAPDGPAFGPADDRLLSGVAAQLGLAVERRHLRREATEAEILRRADDLKNALLNAVSHNLRTPLASIIASAGSLLQRDVAWSDQEREEFAQAIDEEARRLNRIVANMLNLSRIKSGNLQPEKGWYDLGALIDDVLGRLRPITARHRVEVEVQEDLPPLLLDYVEMDQVLSNLVENAVKYAPAGTEIRVSARLEEAEVRVEIADEGPGIPAVQAPQLFEPFSRLEGGRPRQKGTGLGLAVARGLVEAHGGRIWFRNRPGGGAVFAFTLPAAGIKDLGKEREEPV